MTEAEDCDYIWDYDSDGEYIWLGYKFKNYYDDSLTKSKEELDSYFIKDNKNKLIIITHGVHFNLKKSYKGEYPYENKLFYYIKVPNDGLTYRNLFKQIDEQSKKFIKSDLQYEDHRFIEHITKKTDISYDLWCGS